MTNQFGACEEASSAALALDQDDGGAVDSPQELDQASASVHLKQSGLLPAFLWPMRAREKPNIFLIGMKPYQSMLPKPIQDMIDQQIRPQTDELSAQILSSMPGAEQWYQQVSDFLDMFSNFGPQNFLGGGGGGGSSSSGSSGSSGGSPSLSNLMSGFGKRR